MSRERVRVEEKRWKEERTRIRDEPLVSTAHHHRDRCQKKMRWQVKRENCDAVSFVSLSIRLFLLLDGLFHSKEPIIKGMKERERQHKDEIRCDFSLFIPFLPQQSCLSLSFL